MTPKDSLLSHTVHAIVTTCIVLLAAGQAAGQTPVTCGNPSTCDEGEDTNNCPSDCGIQNEGYCGDGACSAWLFEDSSTCPADCHGYTGYCGDGSCVSWAGEDGNTCPADCIQYTGYCGDTVCAPWAGEDGTTCPADCEINCGGEPCTWAGVLQQIDFLNRLECGQTTTGWITFRNSGTTPWQQSQQQLVPSPSQLSASSGSLTANVAPNGTATYAVSITAPLNLGEHTAAWSVAGVPGATASLTVSAYGDACANSSTIRFVVRMDDGSHIKVDNISSFTRAQVEALVVRADRSTRSACVEEPVKGLFRRGDRVLVANNYLAWFDYTGLDGVIFDPGVPPYAGTWHRAGELAGFWALDAGRADFRYKTSRGSCQWPRNQLITGSASANGESEHQDEFWWDKFGPPTEQCVSTGTALPSDPFYCHHYSPYSRNARWRPIQDGVRDQDGRVHYETRGYLANQMDNPDDPPSRRHAIDIVDGDDGENGGAIANSIDSSVHYICGQEGIQIHWLLRPDRQSAVVSNLLMDTFAAYAQDEDGEDWLDRDRGRHYCNEWPGEQWPTVDFPLPRYHLSSESLFDNRTGVSHSPLTVVEMSLGATCPDGDQNNQFFNPSIAAHDPRPEAWLAIGENASVSTSARRLILTLRRQGGDGSGTVDDPIGVQWKIMFGYNETRDGTLGFGIGRGPRVDTTLERNKWYEGWYCLSPNFSCTPYPPGPPPTVTVSNSTVCSQSVGVGCTTTFTASATDPEGRAVSYAWEGCGLSPEETLVCSRAGSGTVTATATVENDQGVSATATDAVTLHPAGHSVGAWGSCTPAGEWSCTAAGPGGCTRTGSQTRSVVETSWTLDPLEAVAPPTSSQSCSETAPGYVTSYSSAYDASWTCTASGANGCRKNRISYTPTAFGPAGPDAPVPPATVYTYGYAATWATGAWSACTAACGGGWQSRSFWAASWKADPPDTPHPSDGQPCNTHPCELTCYDYPNSYETWGECYGAGWTVCETRYRSNGTGGWLTCRVGFE